jgi:hypothetical protein
MTESPRPSRWSRPLRFGLSALVLLAIAAGAAYRWIETMPVGTGEVRVSPDGRYNASVFDYFDRDFFTNESRRWFEFRVTGPGADYTFTGTPLPGPYFGSRSSDSVIRWEPDSSAVRFVFPTSELRIGVRPAER